VLDEEAENLQIQHNQHVLASLTEQELMVSQQQSYIQQSPQAPASATQHANDYLESLIEEVRIYRCLWDRWDFLS